LNRKITPTAYNNVGTIIYNDGNYIYNIHGNISKEELVKIAQNAE